MNSSAVERAVQDDKFEHFLVMDSVSQYSSSSVPRSTQKGGNQDDHIVKCACHVPQHHGTFEYTMNDWKIIPHYPGEVTLSPPFSMTDKDQWVLQVFPEGRNAHKSGNIVLSLCNMMKSTVRATCKLHVVGRGQDHSVVKESQPAQAFSHIGEWEVDTGITFAEVSHEESDWLQEDGSLCISVEITICGDPEVLERNSANSCGAYQVPNLVAPSLADDMLHLLDVHSSMDILPTGEKTTTTTLKGPNNLEMIWKSDITLVSENERISCHQCILAARSPKFRSILQSSGTDMKLFFQAGKLFVDKHVHPSVLKAFVYYLYSDHCDEDFLVEGDGANLPHLMRAASKYEVKGLQALCSRYLLTTLTVNNVADRLALAHSCPGAEKLQSSILHFIVMHSSQVSETDGFRQLNKELYRLVVEEMSASPYNSMARRQMSDEGIDKE